MRNETKLLPIDEKENMPNYHTTKEDNRPILGHKMVNAEEISFRDVAHAAGLGKAPASTKTLKSSNLPTAV